MSEPGQSVYSQLKEFTKDQPGNMAYESNILCLLGQFFIKVD